MPTPHSKILELPNELLFEILYASLYTGREFQPRLDYKDPCARGERFSVTHSWFKNTILLTCKRFYHTGVPLLWRLVIIRSRASLQQIVNIANDGAFEKEPRLLPGNTRRLQVSIPGAYDPRKVGELLSFMGELRVFVFRSHSSPPFRPFPVTPKSILIALVKSTPLVVRVQLDSSQQQPNPSDVIHLLCGLPKLVSLRIHNIKPGPWRGWSREALKERPHPSLKVLSIGPDYDLEALESEMPGLSTALEPLTSRPLLPKLNRLLLFSWTRRTPVLLQVYGSQLKSLLYTTSVLQVSEPHNFLSTCDNLQELMWVVSDHTRLPIQQHLPTKHSQLQIAHLLFMKLTVDTPDSYIRCIQHALETLRDGEFLSLKHVIVHQRGDELPSLEGTTWCRYYTRCFKKGGVCLEIQLP